MTIKLFLSFCLIPLLPMSHYFSTSKNNVYRVTRVSQPININATWGKKPWGNITTLRLSNHMGDMPKYKPEVQAKVAYDEKHIYVIFHVQHQYLKCKRTQYQSDVYKDSCVEFFFTPGPDVSKGYFNLEINCIGTALFKFHDIQNNKLIEIPKSDFNKIKIAHSIPSVVNPEVKGPITWTIEYSIPFSMLNKYVDLSYPKPGVKWKANFYKIADESLDPHWLTWSKIKLPEPDFHRPEFFGTLEFE